ncbi:protein lin-54 homolog [Alosa sapidissima]|uniref:protein lin-54 homolog n=1 Tax=Alosa sapidissima TaxID=34773 RepID=UPI001C0A0E4F|nr:protein lin-54 homolog [Alosa sapidissima]XP_041936942.1 protein lin-54 homolog [Alosa sapidissima]
MDVVPPELNSLLPDEIMDTEAIVTDDDLPAVCPAPPNPLETQDAPVPMETEVPEIVTLCTAAPSIPVQRTQALTTLTSTDSTPSSGTGSTGTQLLLTPSSSTMTLQPTSLTLTAPKPSSPQVTGSLQKLSTPLALPANHQLILNKVASSPGSEAKPTMLKPDGQKLVLTALGKAGQPIVLALPPGAGKAGTMLSPGDGKGQPPQFKVVTIGGRTDLKPIGVQAVSTASQLIGTSQTAQQGQQLKTLQITKKIPVSTAAPVITKYIITKALNSKGLTSQTSVSPVVTGRVLTQSTPGTPPRTITVADALSTSGGSKVAISPLKSPSKLTVVSVASPSPTSPQKSVAVPLSVALGQQILTMQQSTPTSPAKAGVSLSAQNVKPVQTVSMGGVPPQFKTIVPLATPPNVQQIQVPGSRFHYVRLVTASSGSHTVTGSSPSSVAGTIQPAKPMVVNSAAVRMSVPIVSAQTVKQVVPKPLTSASPQVVTSQQQRLIMPATPLQQIQPLPPGTLLAPAHGQGNMGYAVLSAPYVTQLQQSTIVTLASNSGFSTPSSVQTQARLPLNGLSASDSTSRPRKPCNCTKSQCLKLYCDCFANGEFCSNCNCTNCFNNLEHESERLKAIKACLDRNPEAFKPKIGKGKEGESDRRHSKGCNCKRSGCLKNYCECYEAKIMCSSICKCVGCKNFEESPERKTLMHLADAAEVRVQQQTAAKTKLSSQISDLLTRTTPTISSGGGKLPYTFVTKEVAEATCDCLMETAEQAELSNQSQAMAERVILEEFGRCLKRIINYAGKAKTDCC